MTFAENASMKIRVAFCVAACVGGLTGCTPHRDISLISVPAGATLKITKVLNGVPAEDVPVPAADPKTNVTDIRLMFPKENLPRYQVTAKLDRYLDGQTTINWHENTDMMMDPGEMSRGNYTIALVEYKRLVDDISFVPSHGTQVWHMASYNSSDMAYLLNFAEPTNGAATQLRQVTPTRTDVITDYQNIAASPSSDELVYQKLEKQTDGSWHSRIFRRDVGKGTETQLTSNPAMEYTPTYSYGGDSVIFSSDNDTENPRLWKISAAHSGPMTSLTHSDSADFAPSVGATSMIYCCLPPLARQPQIWIARLDGTQAGYLTEGTDPQLSPDEKLILFLRPGREGKSQIWLMDKNGDNLRKLTTNTDYDISDPRWSPDGKWIAYASNAGKDQDGQACSNIWLVSAAGSGRTIQLTRNGSFDGCPAWDKGGRTVYFRSNRGGAWNIWRVEIRDGILDAN